MLTRMRRGLTYANVMSTLAVFAVLGGGAWAAATIGPNEIEKNAVRTRHIRSEAVQASKIAAGAVNSAKVADASLTGADIDQSTLRGVDAAKLGGFSAGELGGGIMLGSITDMINSSLPSNISPVGITQGGGSGGVAGAPAPVDIEVSDLRINAPLFDPGDSVTFAIASSSLPTAVSCTATVDRTTCDSGSARATIPAGNFVSIRYAGGGIHDRNLAFFGWRYRTLP
jgi:hypothetical protein